MSELLDLGLYVSIVDSLDQRDARGRIGAGEAAFEWIRTLGLLDSEEDYVLMGLARLAGHPKGEDWDVHGDPLLCSR